MTSSRAAAARGGRHGGGRRHGGRWHRGRWRGGGAGGKAGTGGGPIDVTWGCFDLPPLEPTGQLVDLELEVVNGITRQPAVGALVRARGRLDVDCERPMIHDTLVGEGGKVTLAVPESFNGYCEFRSTAETPDPYVPELFYLPTREILRGQGRRAVLFEEAYAVPALAALVGGSFARGEPPTAFAIATALDCTGAPATQVSFALTSSSSASASTRPLYTDENNLPRADATETSAAGTFGLTNLNPGLASLSATVNPLQPMGDDAVFLTCDDWLTLVYVAPD